MGNQPSKLNLKEQGVADALSVKGSTFYEETIPLALNSDCFANPVTIFHYLEHICHPALLAPLTKQRFSIGQWIVVVDLTEVVPLFMKSKGFFGFINFCPVSKLDNANRANSSFWWEFFGLVVHFLCRGYYY